MSDETTKELKTEPTTEQTTSEAAAEGIAPESAAIPDQDEPEQPAAED
jgi:hypothetical protein